MSAPLIKQKKNSSEEQGVLLRLEREVEVEYVEH